MEKSPKACGADDQLACFGSGLGKNRVTPHESLPFTTFPRQLRCPDRHGHELCPQGKRRRLMGFGVPSFQRTIGLDQWYSLLGFHAGDGHRRTSLRRPGTGNHRQTRLCRASCGDPANDLRLGLHQSLRGHSPLWNRQRFRGSSLQSSRRHTLSRGQNHQTERLSCLVPWRHRHRGALVLWTWSPRTWLEDPVRLHARPSCNLRRIVPASGVPTNRARSAGHLDQGDVRRMPQPCFPSDGRVHASHRRHGTGPQPMDPQYPHQRRHLRNPSTCLDHGYSGGRQDVRGCFCAQNSAGGNAARQRRHQCRGTLCPEHRVWSHDLRGSNAFCCGCLLLLANHAGVCQ